MTDTLVRWEVTAVLLAVTGLVFLPIGRYLSATAHAHAIRGDDAVMARILAAAGARDRVEDLPRSLGLLPGSISIALAFLVWFRLVAPTVALGLALLSLGAALAYAYARIRSGASRRAAVLRPRSIGAPIPYAFYALAVATAVAVLTYAAVPGLRSVAILITCGSLCAVALTFVVSSAPTVLLGNDVAAERLLDERIRFSRTYAQLFLAYTLPLLFCTSAVRTAPWLPHIVIQLGVTAAYCAYLFWASKRIMLPISSAALPPV